MIRNIIFESVILNEEEKSLVRAKRFGLSLSCTINTKENTYLGETINISQTGFLIELKNKKITFNKDQQLEISLKLKDYKINATCEVKYAHGKTLGLHIVDISSQDSTKLDSLLLNLVYQNVA